MDRLKPNSGLRRIHFETRWGPLRASTTRSFTPVQGGLVCLPPESCYPPGLARRPVLLLTWRRIAKQAAPPRESAACSACGQLAFMQCSLFYTRGFCFSCVRRGREAARAAAGPTVAAEAGWLAHVHGGGEPGGDAAAGCRCGAVLRNPKVPRRTAADLLKNKKI